MHNCCWDGSLKEPPVRFTNRKQATNIRKQGTATGSQSERATPESSPNPRSACWLFGFHEFTYTVLRHLGVVKIPKIKSKYFFL